jgi:hypothetical protein
MTSRSVQAKALAIREVAALLKVPCWQRRLGSNEACSVWSRERLGKACSMKALNGVERFDRAGVNWVMAHRKPRLDEFFVLGSHTGGKGVPWSVLLVMLRLRARGGERISLRRGLAINSR